ncbi:Gfo/Idh/MocA family protein [Streptomyces griseus]|uniref:Gfo/Idh/MocA family protein n=1 Tax=Streptomyces griseus TaxID=1911 RepID=UPI000A98BA1F|nr:Gfo/Idh/MocA family oxidoreductase [Streptomyces griseus]
MSESGPKRSLRMGVIGCADIAVRRLLPVLRASDAAELVMVASRNEEKAVRIGERFGCEATVDYDHLLDRPDIDAVYIPLPPGLHYEWITKALRAGKHVLAEKPLCTDYAQAVELMDLARELGLVLKENFIFLHHSQHNAVRTLLDEDSVGRLQVFSSSFAIPPLDPATWRYDPKLGGGALLDVGVYPLRAAHLHLAGELEVLAATLRVDPATGVDVAGSALLATPDGVAVQLAFGFEHSYQSTYTLWGSRGRLTVTRAFTPPEDMKPLVRIEQQDRLTELALPADHQVRNAVQAFVHMALTMTPSREAEETTLRQALVIEQIRAAATVHT